MDSVIIQRTPSASSESNVLTSAPSDEWLRSRLSKSGEIFFKSQYFIRTILTGNLSSMENTRKIDDNNHYNNKRIYCPFVTITVTHCWNNGNKYIANRLKFFHTVQNLLVVLLSYRCVEGEVVCARTEIVASVLGGGKR